MGNMQENDEEEEVGDEDDGWISEGDDDEEDGCLAIRISKEDYAAMCHPWK